MSFKKGKSMLLANLIMQEAITSTCICHSIPPTFSNSDFKLNSLTFAFLDTNSTNICKLKFQSLRNKGVYPMQIQPNSLPCSRRQLFSFPTWKIFPLEYKLIPALLIIIAFLNLEFKINPDVMLNSFLQSQ